MGATNAKTIDLRAFGLRGIEAPSFPVAGPPVNRVLRFHSFPQHSSVHEKSPRDVSPTGRIARPAPQRCGVSPPASLRYRPAGARHLIAIRRGPVRDENNLRVER